MWAISGPLFYAYTNSQGTLQLEFKDSWKIEVPQIGLGEGDFTFTRIESF